MAPDPSITSAAVRLPKVQGRSLSAHLARPAGDGPFPGVVVIHEILGLNDNIREIAGRFAEAGYVALAVDLLSAGSRAVCMARLFSGLMIQPLENGTVSQLRGALDFLQTLPEVESNRIGAIGFCLGGSYALQLACVDNDLRVVAVFYGMNPRPLEAIARSCPIVGSYPERDFTAKAARTLQVELASYSVPHDIKIYPNSVHSFMNDRNKTYNPVAAEDAWRRTLAFFDQQLRGGAASTNSVRTDES